VVYEGRVGRGADVAMGVWGSPVLMTVGPLHADTASTAPTGNSQGRRVASLRRAMRPA